MYLCIALINNREANKNGFLAQLVEQRTENPCVPGSTPGGTTTIPPKLLKFRGAFFFLYGLNKGNYSICVYPAFNLRCFLLSPFLSPLYFKALFIHGGLPIFMSLSILSAY